MNKIYSADWIFPVIGDPIHEGAVEVNEDGLIVQIYSHRKDVGDRPMSIYKGIIVPGFVNAHCHLELSHMLGKIPQGLGLPSFIENVMKHRQANEQVRWEAMVKADQQMYKNGIVAVGDHVNTNHTMIFKQESPLYYHTFIEMLGFDPRRANDVFENAENLQHDWLGASSITPHAPYSVSRELMKCLKKTRGSSTQPLSIHNQESEEENKFFRYKTGEFVHFYQRINQSIDVFKAQAKTSLQTYLPLLPKHQPLMLVHNTFTSSKDVYFAERINREITWCLCPKANLYIEGKLPKLPLFMDSKGKIAIGTDSLASNDSLCILSELKTLQAQYPTLTIDQTIAWATLNGAIHLQIADTFGSIEVGKKPGLNLLEGLKGMSLTAASTVQKLC